MKLCTFCETTYADHHTTCGNERCEGRGSRLIPSRQLEPGTLIGTKYRIDRFIGRGGMGTVYLAEHIHLKERHALKFISDDLTHNPKVLKRFQLEAQILRRLIDTNVVTVYDLDQADDGAFYIAMEFVPGLKLGEVISAGPLPVARAIAIARGVASGLAAAHAKGIIHRDIKPDNILLDHSAFHTTGIETPKLLDFGIAAVKETSTAMSRTHGLMLTPEYAAPEQWAGMPADQIDGRTDLYALGGVLHEMLTGTTGLQSPTPGGWMYQHLQAERTAPSQQRPELANWPGLDALVLSLLAKDRNHRPATAAAVVEQLDKLKQRSQTAFEQLRKTQLEDRSTQAPKTPSKPEPARTVLFEQAAPPESRSGKTWLWVASLVAILAIGIGWAAWHLTQPTPVPVPVPVGDTAPPIATTQPASAVAKQPLPKNEPSVQSLTVTAKDFSGAVIPGVAISLKNERLPHNRDYTCTTAADGTCTLDSLPSGTFTLVATSPGFRTFRRSSVSVPPGRNTQTLITMSIGLFTGTTPPPEPSLAAEKLARAKSKFESGNDNCAALQEYEEVVRLTQGKPALSEYNAQAKTGAEQVKKENSNLGVSCDQ